MTDAKGRAAYSARVAGQGDIVVVRAAETFEPGSTLEHDGQTLTVLLDLGSEVEFEVPASSRPLPGGGSLRIAAGHSTTIHKADLILGRL